MIRSYLHRMSALLGILLVAGGPFVRPTAAAPEWKETCRIAHARGNATLAAAWSPRRGIHLRFVEAGGKGRAAELTIGRHGGALLLFERNAAGRAVERSLQRTRLNPDALPGKSTPLVELTVKFRDDSWVVYAEDRLAAIVVPPFHPPAALFQPADELPERSRNKPRFQKTAPIRFRDDFLSAPKGDNALAPWEPLTGKWSLHAAFQGSWQGRVKKLLPGQLMTEFSPNFYNLGGQGRNAVIVTGHHFYDRYTIRASVQVWPGEMGLVFHLRDTNDYFAFTITKKSLQDPVAMLKLWHVAPTWPRCRPPDRTALRNGPSHPATDANAASSRRQPRRSSPVNGSCLVW